MESSNGSEELTGFATVAYDAASGHQEWAVRDEKGKVFCLGCSGPVLQVNPDGKEVYVTGLADYTDATEDITTVAYDTASGTQNWTTFSPGYQFAAAFGIAVSPDGSHVFDGGATASVNSNSNDLIALGYATGAPPPVQLNRVVSRKMHGTAGPFDLDLPLHSSTVECRSGGANGDYSLIFNFANTLSSVGSATVTNGIGSVGTANIDSSDAHNYIVKLTGVTNAQVITVNLSNVNDSSGESSAGISESLGVLLGDVNGSGRVDAADVSLVRQQTLQPVTNANFRDDVDASGRIDAADVSVVRQQTLTSLP
jgi:hypothetical protein